MTDHLDEFVKYLHDAATDGWAERIVRLSIEHAARNCPVDVLVQIGQCVVECRRDELREDAERN